MRVPTYTRQTRPSNQALVGPSGAGATPEAFGAGVGRGLQNFSQGVGMVAEFVTQQDRQARRFADLRKFSQFQTATNNMLAEAQRGHDPTVGNFQDLARSRYSEMEREFIETIDPEFRDEFIVRTSELGTGVASQALTFQIQNNDSFFRRGLSDAFEEGKVALGQYTTPEEFDAQLMKLETMLEASGLSEAEKVAEMRKYQAELGKVLYKGLQVERLLSEDEGESAINTAAALIGDFAGVTPEEEVILARQGEQLAVESIGSVDLWAQMPARARAALTSLASDLGGLPDDVVAAVMSGDLEAVSEAVRALGGDRRTQEADLILDPGAQIDDDPRLAMVPYEDRLALLADAQRIAANEIIQSNKAQAAQNASMINQLMVGLYDGTAGQADIDRLRELNILTDVDDIMKAQRLLDEAGTQIRLAAQGQAMLAQGIEFNPMSDDDKKILNAMVGDQGKKALQQRDSEYVTTQLLPIVNKSTDIPSEALGTLIGMMRSNNQQDMLWALDTLMQVQQAAPRAFSQRTDQDVESAVNLYNTRKEFYQPDELRNLINGGLTQADRQQQEYLRKEAQELLTGNKVPGRKNLTSFFQTGVFMQGAAMPSNSGAATQLRMDFDSLFVDQYPLYNGDVRAAEEATVKLLNRVWGTTQVGADGKLMKFPPEKVYPPVAGSYDWMEQQVRDEGNVPADATFELIGDMQTEVELDAFRTGGPPPSYAIVTKQNGVWAVTLGPDGMPMRQYFEITDAEKAAQEEWRVNQQRTEDIKLRMRQLEEAERHSLETGIPIPEGSEAEEAMGIRDYMMQEE
jgi:hypothetical protein